MRGRRFTAGRGLTVGRSFESRAKPGPTRNHRYGAYYQRLLRLTLRHGYYNESDGLAPNFSITPTHFTARWMADVGLLFEPELSGFSVLYDEARQDLLLRFLARQAVLDPGSPELRLSFVAALKNPYFINFTRMSIADNPAERNFYYSNEELSGGGSVGSGEGLEIARLTAQGPFEVVSTQVAVPIEPERLPEVAAVQLVDIADRVVQCHPRCPLPQTVEHLKPLLALQCGDLEYLPTACDNDTVFLDFGLLPEGRYRMQEIDPQGQILTDSAPVLFTEAYPQPFAFLDLFLADSGAVPGTPTPGFPVASDFSTIEAVSYEVDFEPRSTIWRYHVVPRPQAELTDIVIEQIDPERAPFPVTFTAAEQVPLAGGGWAYRLQSEQELDLRQESPWRFRLTAWRGESELSLERLPVASVEQVSPLVVRMEPDQEPLLVNFSDVYVTL